MTEEFNFNGWYDKMMTIPNEVFDKELQRIESERDERYRGWLRSKEAGLSPSKVKGIKEDSWQEGLD